MKLSDFKDEKAMEVVAALLEPIANIVKSESVQAARGKSVLEMAKAMLTSNAKDVKDMFAILSDIDPAEYHCSAASVMADVLSMLNDPELMELFGLRSKKAASSGSASESTEAQSE